MHIKSLCFSVLKCLLLAFLFYSSCAAENRILVTLQETRPHEYFGRLNVGPVEDGADRKVSFRMINPGDSEVILQKPTGTCGCVRVEMSSVKIAPGGSVDGVLSIKVDAKRQAFWRQMLFFDGDKFGESSVELEVVSEITGLLAFRDKEFLIQVFGSGNRQERAASERIIKSLQFTATPPLKIETLELSLTPPHPAIESEIVRIDDKSGELHLSIDMSRVGPSATTLSCLLKDRVSGKSAGIRGVIATRSPISVLPSIVRFSRGDDGRLIGHAVVARLVVDRAHETDAKNPANVSARLLGTRLTIITRQATRSVARVSVQIPESLEERLAEESDARINWDVMWGSDRATSKSKVYVDREPILSSPSHPIQ